MKAKCEKIRRKKNEDNVSNRRTRNIGQPILINLTLVAILKESQVKELKVQETLDNQY